LPVVTVGEGLVRVQKPEPGSFLLPGEKVRVELARY
jgi:hypothetical protein